MPSNRKGASVRRKPAPLQFVPHRPACDESGVRGVRLGSGVVAAAASAGVVAAAAPAAAAHAPLTGAYLHTGSAGSTVSQIQHALHVKATGRFNGATEHAVVAFQRRDGLGVDGIVGPQTWDALFHIAAPASTSTTSTATSESGSGGYSIPSSIVSCESGGNYSAVNPSSGAGGAYQILPSTWAAYGGQGLPQDASPAEQGAIAAKIYASQGASAWSC
jgi:peptidoglycan hydrolase-like protein with peptidoglycan-binding domain